MSRGGRPPAAGAIARLARSVRERPAAWALVLGLLVLALNGGSRKLVSNAVELRRLEADAAALASEKPRLEAAIRRLKGLDLELERAARLELGLRKPNEVEYRFPPPVKR